MPMPTVLFCLHGAFYSSSPWILHCHIDLHLQAGLAVVFAEAPDDVLSGADSVDPDDEWDELCPIYNALPADQQ
jgi:iron transport multicopper oxidase